MKNIKGFKISKNQLTRRIIDITIDDETIDKLIFPFKKFDLTAIEPLQYGEYAKTQQYSWHVDQHNQPYKDNMIRKMSFSVFLNDDYTGGEFDLEIFAPHLPERFKTFTKLPLNSILFFQSDYWHRVRPVTKGVRKSLVGWVLGPKFK